MGMIQLTGELIIGFISLFLVIKLVGKKVMKQITPFTFIASIVFGELLGNAVYDDRVSMTKLIYTIALWGLLIFVAEYFGQKSLRFRRVFDGEPSTLIKQGMIDFSELKRNRMNLNQLQSLLRQSETFSVREVAYCYLETNGSLSILKKAQYQKTTQEDFNMPSSMVHAPVTLIRDRQVLWKELHHLGFNEDWLKAQLKSHQVTSYQDVLLAEWLEGDGLFIQTF